MTCTVINPEPGYNHIVIESSEENIVCIFLGCKLQLFFTYIYAISFTFSRVIAFRSLYLLF